eukprot:UN09897
MVSYIAMSPKSKISDLAIEYDEYMKYRSNAYRVKTTTGHWPHKVNVVNELTEMELRLMKQKDLDSSSDVIKSLVGDI